MCKITSLLIKIHVIILGPPDRLVHGDGRNRQKGKMIKDQDDRTVVIVVEAEDMMKIRIEAIVAHRHGEALADNITQKYETYFLIFNNKLLQKILFV